MASRVVFRMNGVGNAFLREIGCECPLCSAKEPAAQTSGSLFVFNDRDELTYHLLFDCGLGVVDSLLAFSPGNDGRRVDIVTHVFISHRHPDHILELDRLLQGCLRSARRTRKETRIPCYCTSATRKGGPDLYFPYLAWDRVDVLPGLPVTPYAYCGHGVYGDTGLGIELRVTPVAVYHGNPSIVPDPVIWVVDFSLPEMGHKRIVLGWDMLHLVPKYHGEDAEDCEKRKYTGSTVSDLHPSHEVLRNADLLVLPGNTFEPSPNTGHMSVDAALRCTVRLLQPNGPVWIVHYSGHEDPQGSMTLDELQLQVKDRQENYQLAHEVFVARQGATWQP